ncbi:MAG: hypothetical protein ACK4NS_12795 [Saprospiraceae bacterium]
MNAPARHFNSRCAEFVHCHNQNKRRMPLEHRSSDVPAPTPDSHSARIAGCYKDAAPAWALERGRRLFPFNI